VIAKEIVQSDDGGSVPPASVTLLAAVTAVNVPPQPFEAIGVAATVTFDGSASVNAAPVTGAVLTLRSTIDSVDEAPRAIAAGEALIVSMGGA
jgi:hypothetical protein